MAWGDSPFHRECGRDDCDSRIHAPPSMDSEDLRCYDHWDDLDEQTGEQQ